MTKKRTILTIFGIVCVCVLSCAFVLTGCGNKHKFGSEWSSDSEYHWHQCTKHDDDADDVEDKAGHTWSDWEGTAATCTEAADRSRYCTVCGYTETDTTAALDHDYTVTWTWAEDYSTASVTRVCKYDSTHTDTAAGTITSSVDETSGDTTYTATAAIGDDTYTDSVTVKAGGEVVPGEGTTHEHSYGAAAIDWTSFDAATDKTSVTVTYTCTDGSCDDADGAKVVTITATVTSDTTGAKCTADGRTTYTASWTSYDGSSCTDTHEVTISATGHTYAEPAETDWTWTEDTGTGDYTVTVKVSCTSGDDEQTLTAVVTSSEDSENNTIIYTATATINGQTFTATKTVKAPIELKDAVVGVSAEDEVPYNSVNFQNASDLEVTFDETSKTFTVTGTANWMTPEQADAFGAKAEVGDGYVVIGFYLNAGETISWTTSLEENKSWSKDSYPDDDLAVIVRITETNKNQQFTITSAGDTTGVTITVVFDVELPGDEWRVVAIPANEDISYSRTDDNGTYTATFANDYDLEVEFYVDDEGTLVFVVTGEASKMRNDTNNDQVSAFGADAQVGDAYVIIGFYLKDGETLKWTTSLGEPKSSKNNEIAMIERITSAYQCQTFYIYGEENDSTPVCTIKIVFSDLVEGVELKGRVVVDNTLVNIPYQGGTFSNENDVDVTFEEESYTFTVTGTAGTMDTTQAAAFGGEANEGDAYVIVGLILNVGETVAWTTTGGEHKSWTKTKAEDDLALIVRVTHRNQEQVYTVYDANGNEICVFTVVYFGFVDVVLEERVVEIPTEESIPYSRTDDEGTHTANFSNSFELTVTFDGTDTFTVTGTASEMNETQAKAFGGAAQEKDAYVVVGFILNVGETIVWTTTGGEQKYWTKTEDNADDDLAIIVRITSTTQKQVFTVYSSDYEVVCSFTVVFSDLIDGVALNERVVEVPSTENVPYTGANGTANFSNDSEVKVEYDENESTEDTTVFVVSGTATQMTEEQAKAFGAGATENDYYVVIGFCLNLNETISWTTSLGEYKSWTKTNAGDDLAIIERINETSGYQIFYITDVAGNTVATIKVVFSGVQIPSDEDENETTVNIHYDFTNSDYRATISGQFDLTVDSNGDGTNDARASSTITFGDDGILSLYDPEFKTKLSASGSSARFETGGSSYSSKNYFVIDLTEYSSGTVTITVEFTSGTSSTGSSSATAERSLYVATTAEDPSNKTEGDSEILKKVTSEGSDKNHSTLTIEVNIEDLADSTLYLLYDNGLYIFSIDITVVGSAETTD